MTDVKLTMDTTRVEQVVREAAERGLRKGGDIVLAESNRHVPVEPDRKLLESGKVTQDGTTVAVAYDTPYAVIQHERMNYHHDPGRHAKFLEKAALAKRREVEEAVAAEVRRALGL